MPPSFHSFVFTKGDGVRGASRAHATLWRASRANGAEDHAQAARTRAAQSAAYGFCLTVHERIQHQLATHAAVPAHKTDTVGPVITVYVPKTLCLLSHWPYFAAFRMFLTQLHAYSHTDDAVHKLPVEGSVVVSVPRTSPPAGGEGGAAPRSCVGLWWRRGTSVGPDAGVADLGPWPVRPGGRPHW